MKKTVPTVLLVTIMTTSVLFGCTAKEPENTYVNEVTGSMMDEALKDQRPVAIMLDGGTKSPGSNIDYLYTTNSGTKKLALIKDWKKIKKTGNIGESDQTAQQIAPGWNAVLIADTTPSDGLPYLDEIQASEVTGKDIEKKMDEAGISEEYNEFHSGGTNLVFEEKGDMSTLEGAVACANITTPNGQYTYDEKSKQYQNESGEEYKNIILQNAVYLGLSGEDRYNLNDSSRDGWYIREGYAIPVTWAKLIDLEPTKFYGADGEEIKLSEGSTLINIIDTNEWDKISLS